GRPAKRYRRSDKEVPVSLPDRRYDLAGALLADAVSEAAATGRPAGAALAEAARRTGMKVGAATRHEMRGRRSARAVKAAALATLERFGYEPRAQRGEVVLFNCPFHALAERHRDLVCGMNLELLAGLAEGLDEQGRLASRLQPTEGMCCVRLAL
ncbi:MAG TPA: transcriptional regulator, partial [Acidimicrobiales bacterium]|nr:transcriptional regulator [Acidimicrobiales bacterium]